MIDGVANDSTWFQHIIAGDETWVFDCDIETKNHLSRSLQMNQDPKKIRQV